MHCLGWSRTMRIFVLCMFVCNSGETTKLKFHLFILVVNFDLWKYCTAKLKYWMTFSILKIYIYLTRTRFYKWCTRLSEWTCCGVGRLIKRLLKYIRAENSRSARSSSRRRSQLRITAIILWSTIEKLSWRQLKPWSTGNKNRSNLAFRYENTNRWLNF